MTYFWSEQNRSRLRLEILAAFCVNKSGRIKEKALYIADIQGFLLSIGGFFLAPSGAENGTRTRDLNLGKVALYQLSYFRITLQTFRFVSLSLFIREVLFTLPRMFVNLATSRSRCLYRIASAKICQKNYSPKLL